MVVGVPRERLPLDHCVALVPACAELPAAHHHTVLVEQEAGIGSGFMDEWMTITAVPCGDHRYRRGDLCPFRSDSKVAPVLPIYFDDRQNRCHWDYGVPILPSIGTILRETVDVSMEIV